MYIHILVYVRKVIHMYIYMWLYIYIQREAERQRERERTPTTQANWNCERVPGVPGEVEDHCDIEGREPF